MFLKHDIIFVETSSMATQESSEVLAQRILRITDVAKEPLELLAPIGGYAKMPLVSLEEAVQPLIDILPDVQSHAYVAKQKCRNPADGLTPDESASIMLYTMSWDPMDECLYIALNRTLRSTDRQQELKPWYSYLRLFLNALSHLPPLRRTVHRGVKLDMSKRYAKGTTVVWWGFSSCTTEVEVLQCDLFLGETEARTLFSIETETARDIRKHSFFPMENEVLLMAATQFQVVSSLKQSDLRIIQLKETHPPHPLLQPVTTISQTAPSAEVQSSKTKYQNAQLEEFMIENQNARELDLSRKKLVDSDMSIVTHYLLKGNKVLLFGISLLPKHEFHTY